MDSAEFDIDRSIATAWQAFAERLGEVVSVIDDGGSLTVSTMSEREDPAPYVTFTHIEHEPDLILAEASSNASLGDGFQLSDAQLDEMEAAGWAPPSVAGPHPSPDFTMVKPQEESEALTTCATDALWSIFGVQHPVFLAPDQLAEILHPEPLHEEAGPTSRFDPDDLTAQMPRDRADLDDMVTQELTEMFGHPPIRDADGDVTIRVGSSMVFVRTTPAADEIVLFSAMVHDVEGRSRAVEVLNDLNVEAKFGRFALYRDRVFVTMSLLAHPFVAAHLHQGVRRISQLADDLDDMLAAKLRGRTTFKDED